MNRELPWKQRDQLLASGHSQIYQRQEVHPPTTHEQQDFPNTAPDMPQSTENSARVKRTLIIGDSIIRDISERGLNHNRGTPPKYDVTLLYWQHQGKKCTAL